MATRSSRMSIASVTMSERLTVAQRAALAGVVFFATVGVGAFALTFPPPAQFAAGLGWAWVLWRIHRWEESVDA